MNLNLKLEFSALKLVNGFWFGFTSYPDATVSGKISNQKSKS